MEFRILGPLQILAAGRQLALTAPSLRVLLAVQLLRANQAVSAERLIDELWGQTPPARAEAALRMAVSRLRRVLRDGGATSAPAMPLRRGAGGYLLQIEPRQLDAWRFERLVAEGHQALAEGAVRQAAERLRAGLALWRGPALTDVPFTPLVSGEAARLEAVRLAALEARIEADLALGRHAELVPELEALVAEQPLREGLHRQLMVALNRAGRRVDALAVYRELRHRLVDELGVEPSPALQRLERAVLTGDPALQPATAVPRELPSQIASFTGRQRELAQLDRILGASGQPWPAAIAAIHGPGGTGKSVLAMHAAHQVADRFPDGQLYVNLHGATPGLAPLEPLKALGHMLASLGGDATRIPANLDQAAAQFRSLTSGRRLLVVLDNARDAPQVRPLLPAGPACGVLVTSRQPLATLEGARHLRLEVLPCDQAVELLGRIAGAARISAEPQAAAEVVRRCGRLPLAIQIAGARLAARPGWPVSELAGRLVDVAGRLDELELADVAVRACFDVSVRALQDSPNPIDRQAVAAFGLVSLPDGPDIGVQAAAALLDRPESATRILLERLVDAQLLQTPRPGRYQFHDLVRLFAREHAARLHPELERLAAMARLLRFYLAMAWRGLALLRPGDQRLRRADERWVSAGLELCEVDAALAWLQAERANLLAAVAQTAATPGVPATLASQLAHTLFGLFGLLVARGDPSDGAGPDPTALEIAGRASDRAAQAMAEADLALAYRLEGGYDQALACLQQSLTMHRELLHSDGPSGGLGDLGIPDQWRGWHQEALAWLQESLAIHRRLGNRRGQAIDLCNSGLAYERLGRDEEALACHQESLTMFLELGDHLGRAISLRALGVVHGRLGRYQEASAFLQESASVFRELGDHGGQAKSLVHLGLVNQWRGCHQEALACLQESLAMFRKLGDRRGEAGSLRELGRVWRLTGAIGRARTAWRKALAIYETLRVPGADEIRALLVTLRAEAFQPASR
jgi:DNA-binding SARP family transcriptional activator